MAGLVKLALAVLLPVSLYFSTVNLPLRDASWLTFINNALWVATALYFVVYVPVKGLGLKNWVAKVLVALLAVSLLTTSFQAAVKDRAARYELQK
ncbi:MAG TPA: hypothetical protein VD973_03585 [Symbiobacteriaceae bacterium]|jgi:hypothetical protein|nr:hypothetical protein [Symbiobacteriaceae bacterium]